MGGAAPPQTQGARPPAEWPAEWGQGKGEKVFTRDLRSYVLAMLGYHDNVGQLENDVEQNKPDTHVLTLHDSIYGERKNR